MRLIPPTISERTRSDGERVEDDALAVASAPGSMVLRSFDIADHHRRLAGEIDFLCIVPGQGVLVLSPYGNERCAAVRLIEQPWRDRLAPLVTEPGDDGEEDEEVGDWLAACIPSDLDAVDLRSSKIKYSSIYLFKGLEAPAVVVTDVHALDTPGQRSLLCVGCARAAPAGDPRRREGTRAADNLTGGRLRRLTPTPLRPLSAVVGCDATACYRRSTVGGPWTRLYASRLFCAVLIADAGPGSWLCC